MEELNTKKLSYEQLENVATELANQVRVYETQLKNNQFNETVARLNYLFKVVEFGGAFEEEYVKVLNAKEEDIPSSFNIINKTIKLTRENIITLNVYSL